jgi:hypothetical protein
MLMRSIAYEKTSSHRCFIYVVLTDLRIKSMNFALDLFWLALGSHFDWETDYPEEDFVPLSSIRQ